MCWAAWWAFLASLRATLHSAVGIFCKLSFLWQRNTIVFDSTRPKKAKWLELAKKRLEMEEWWGWWELSNWGIEQLRTWPDSMLPQEHLEEMNFIHFFICYCSFIYLFICSFIHVFFCPFVFFFLWRLPKIKVNTWWRWEKPFSFKKCEEETPVLVPKKIDEWTYEWMNERMNLMNE